MPWSIKPCKIDSSDQKNSLDADHHVDFTARQLGIYSQKDWTNPTKKMNLNQLVDDAARKFAVAQAINFADLAKQAQL